MPNLAAQIIGVHELVVREKCSYKTVCRKVRDKNDRLQKLGYRKHRASMEAYEVWEKET